MTAKPRQFDNRNPVEIKTSGPIYDFDASAEQSEYERFVSFAGKLVAVPKAEIDSERQKA